MEKTKYWKTHENMIKTQSEKLELLEINIRQLEVIPYDDYKYIEEKIQQIKKQINEIRQLNNQIIQR